MGCSVRGATRPSGCLAGRHAYGRLPARTPSTTGSTCSSRSPMGSPRAGRPGPGRREPEPSGSPRPPASRHRPAGPSQCGVEIGCQLVVRGGARGRKGPDDHARPGRQPGQVRGYGVTQPAANQVAGRGPTDGPAHDETHDWHSCGPGSPGDRRRRLVDGNNDAPRASTPAAKGSGEVRGPPHAVAGGKHRCSGSPATRPLVRQTAACGPWTGGQRECRDQRGCACAAGTRASWPGAGCSAGTSACSLVSLSKGWWVANAWLRPRPVVGSGRQISAGEWRWPSSAVLERGRHHQGPAGSRYAAGGRPVKPSCVPRSRPVAARRSRVGDDTPHRTAAPTIACGQHLVRSGVRC